jgi:hypothetical protein
MKSSLCTDCSYVDPSTGEVGRAYWQKQGQPRNLRNEGRVWLESTKLRSGDFDVPFVCVTNVTFNVVFKRRRRCIVIVWVVDVAAHRVVRFNGETIIMIAGQRRSLKVHENMNELNLLNVMIQYYYYFFKLDHICQTIALLQQFFKWPFSVNFDLMYNFSKININLMCSFVNCSCGL